MHRKAGTLAAMVFLILLFGCANRSDEKPTVTVEPPVPATREQFGRVAIAPVDYTNYYRVPPPASGGAAGAGSGAGQGALYGLGPGGILCAYGSPACIVGAPLMLAGAIIGSIAGAVVGAVSAHPVEEVVEAEATLRKGIDSIPVDEILADLVYTRAKEIGLTENIGRSSKDPTAAELSANGFDSALLLALPVLSLVKTDNMEGINPDVAVLIVAEARLAKVSHGRKIWSRMWGYRSPQHSFFAFAADEGKLLHEEIIGGLKLVSASIVNDVFVAAQPRKEVEVQTLRDIPAGAVLTVPESIISTVPPN